MARYIRQIYTPTAGELWSNERVFQEVSNRLKAIEAPESEKTALLDYIRLLLIGERSRFLQCKEFLWLKSFADHASAFERAADESVTRIVELVIEDGIQFDAVIGVSSVGQLLPGIADRVSQAFKEGIPRGALLVDLGNGGCTASTRALQLISGFDRAIKNVLVVVIEPTSTLADTQSLARPNWQGICTFGDGAAAIWVSNEPGDGAIEIREVASWQGKELDLIRWDYGPNYYRFGVSDSQQFESKVRGEIAEAMKRIRWEPGAAARWALHPAGMLLMISIARKLGIDRAGLQPSIDHFRRHSNMSSAGILHILKRVMAEARRGEEVRWLSMGAGFHVEYGSGLRVG
jgi:alkylresorcinol/alkylpyrone synthase